MTDNQTRVLQGVFLFGIMKEIQLTRGYVALVDDEDYEYISKFKWQANVKHSGDVYAHRDYLAHEHRSTPGLPKKVKMHRIIMGNPDGFHVDHINGNTLDNRKCNLRLCSRSENLRNSKPQKRSKSGYKGVSISSKTTFSAHIRINNKLIHLGAFKTAKEAAMAYNKAALKHFGEFARINTFEATRQPGPHETPATVAAHEFISR